MDRCLLGGWRVGWSPQPSGQGLAEGEEQGEDMNERTRWASECILKITFPSDNYHFLTSKPFRAASSSASCLEEPLPSAANSSPKNTPTTKFLA